MKKLMSWTISSAAAALLVSTMSFAQPAPAPAAPVTTPAPETTTVVTPAPGEPSSTVVTPAPGEPATKTTTVTAVPVKSTEVIVEKTKPAGFRVCYMPSTRNVEGTRVVERCGPYGGCRNFQITRSFEVTVKADCHIEKYACPKGYLKYGWYPNRMEARDAVDRCQHTIVGGGGMGGTEGWKITY